MRHLQNYVDTIVAGVMERGQILDRDPERVYTLMFKTVLQALGHGRFPEIEDNPIMTSLVEDIRALVEGINSLIGRRITESILYLKNAVDFLERIRGSIQPLYIILCDGLSLPEYMYLIHIFHRSVTPGRALFAVNPSGKTATFKYLAKEYLGIGMQATEEATMRIVGDGLRLRLGASGVSIFRDIDMFIHRGGEYGDIGDMVRGLFKVVDRLRREAERLLDDGYRVLILADHGYDVLKRESLWMLTHRWEKGGPCVSPFAPILVVG
jgi:hypothetical protein